MRIAIRKSNYFEDPYSEGELESIEGDKLNTALLDIFKTSREKRDADILNVIRYSDFSKSYNSKSRIPILEDDKNHETSVKEMEDQIFILLNCIDKFPRSTKPSPQHNKLKRNPCNQCLEQGTAKRKN